MNLDVVFFGILGCVYSLIIAWPRVRRELSATETGACAFVVLLSVLVLAINMTKETHPQFAEVLLLVELGLTVVVICFWLVRIIVRMRQSN